MADKEIPKKVRVDDDSWFYCPNCKRTFGLINSLGKRNMYCGECGQMLDWSNYPRTQKEGEQVER